MARRAYFKLNFDFSISQKLTANISGNATLAIRASPSQPIS
jgi:hypothetical protein